MPELLFVYGTLRSQFDNDWACRLRQSGVALGEASVSGSIYRVEHYPAYRSEPAGTVVGEVYEVPDTLFTLLDEYEGDAFTRESIALNDGRQAWIYKCNAEQPELTRIQSGDFSKE